MAGFFKKLADAFSGGSTGGAKKAAGSASQSGKMLFSGFDPSELKQFMSASSSLGSAGKRVNVSDIAPKFQTRNERVSAARASDIQSGAEKSPLSGTEDQMKGFITAFNLRQDEVFGRRARPGISQTRLV